LLGATVADGNATSTSDELLERATGCEERRGGCEDISGMERRRDRSQEDPFERDRMDAPDASVDVPEEGQQAVVRADQ
jgi:hypothetical protein